MNPHVATLTAAARLEVPPEVVASAELRAERLPELNMMQTAAEEFALALRVGGEAEREFKTAAVAAKDRLSPLQAAVELHRLAFDAKAARGGYEGDEPDDEWEALDGAEHDGLLAVLAAPVADRADAVALVSHLSLFVKGALHPTLKDAGEIACEALAKVIDACSVMATTDDCVTNPRRAYPLFAHR